MSQNTSPEEDLTLTDTIKVGVQLQGLNLRNTNKHIENNIPEELVPTVGVKTTTPKHYHSLAGLFSIHEPFGDGVGCQDLISV